MPRVFSAQMGEAIHRTSPADYALMLMMIEHPDMPEPARVVNDTVNLIGPGGEVFVAAPFGVTLPDESERQLPNATVEIDNVGRDLTDWIERSKGGRNATVTLMIVRAGAPSVIETQYVMSIRSMEVEGSKIVAPLGYENFMDVPGVAIIHDPTHSPGLY